MDKSCVLSLGLCLLVLFHGCLAVREFKNQAQIIQLRRQFQGEQQQSECQISNLDALEPSRRIEAEAGHLEIWDHNNEQFQCAGVAAYRVTIQPKGLSLPVYQNTPQMIYVVKGEGVLGLSIPGCPETFQSFEQYHPFEEEGSRSQRSEDEDSSSSSSTQGSKDRSSKSQECEHQQSRRRGSKSQQSEDQSSRSQESEDQSSRRHESEDQQSRRRGSKSQESEDQSSRSHESEDQQSRRRGSKRQQSEDQSGRSQESEDQYSRSQRSRSQQSEDQSGRSQESEDQYSRSQRSRSQQSEDQSGRSQESEDQYSRSQRSRSQQSEDQSSRSQSSDDQHSKSQRSEDFHQKLRFFKEGDALLVPEGVAYWAYNGGDTPIVAVVVIDTRNNANQLDEKVRNFWLAGNVQEQEEHQQQKQRGQSSSRSEKFGEESSSNIFSGIDVELLSQAFGVRKETVRKLQGENDQRGPIIQAERGLEVIKPILSEEQERKQESNENGLEEALCNMRLRQNIGKATRSDVYTPFGGRLTTLNSQNLPILGFYQLSAQRGHLYKNAILSPHWNINAHSVVYVLRGEAQVQIVGNSGETVFDGQLCEGQLVIVPQNFVVVKQAGDNGFEWISFMTSDNAMTSSLVGRNSIFRAMPEEVLMHSYQISNEEARRLKYNREEMGILSPNFESN
ncbi:PREDICTED: 11S globulin subunit beta-like [Nelumbo nucifera]|uniref:11S globulin subunit beta-like n=1 Tax=Nelumbo nucifera TaxID=4432 RepID=A0A1U8AQ38_NELNU|nr:PREDICTED: 11S globulin subunit beta-like [Nelumbo nucifera]